jgi:hypothetical protein
VDDEHEEQREHGNAEPPPDRGEDLGTLHFRGNHNEVRIRWLPDGDGSGPPVLSIWLWTEGFARDGRKWPDKRKGFKFHLREIRVLYTALIRAQHRAEEYVRERRHTPTRVVVPGGASTRHLPSD